MSVKDWSNHSVGLFKFSLHCPSNEDAATPPSCSLLRRIRADIIERPAPALLSDPTAGITTAYHHRANQQSDTCGRV